MRIACCLVGAALIASPVAAAEWRQAREYELRLSSFDIEPATIRLKAGEPVRLRFVNVSGTAYRLSAPRFFQAAQLRPRDGRALASGSVAIGAGATREILLVPSPGRYSLRSRNLLHRVMGMRGTIVVE